MQFLIDSYGVQILHLDFPISSHFSTKIWTP